MQRAVFPQRAVSRLARTSVLRCRNALPRCTAIYRHHRNEKSAKRARRSARSWIGSMLLGGEHDAVESGHRMQVDKRSATSAHHGLVVAEAIAVFHDWVIDNVQLLFPQKTLTQDVC